MSTKLKKSSKTIGAFLATFLLLGALSIQATHGQLPSMLSSWFDNHLLPEKAEASQLHKADGEPALEDKTTLLAAGDIARCHSHEGFDKTLRNLAYFFGQTHAEPLKDAGALQTRQLIAEHPGVPVLALGDLAYPDGSPADFALCYDTYWGGFKDRTYPAPGNHEYHSHNAYAYYDYWDSQAGPGRRGYYAWEMNGWLILSLNSEVAADEDSDQARWLEAKLKKSDNRCVLAFFHKPAFSTKRRDDSENARRLFELLYRNGVTLVLNGHNHFYERTRPLDAKGRIDADNGITTFVVGTGGTPPDGPRDPAAFSEYLIGNTYGVLKLDLSEGEYAWQFLAAKTGLALDAGRRTCNQRS
nr:metallophosphoesterase [uncultured Halomonas sp.]